MDHVVYLDANAKELDLLLSNQKTMIIRGASGRKMSYGRVNQGDILYFINNNAEGVILAMAEVKNVINSDKLTEEESAQLVNSYQEKLQLTKKQYHRWAGKRQKFMPVPFRLIRFTWLPHPHFVGSFGSMLHLHPSAQVQTMASSPSTLMTCPHFIGLLHLQFPGLVLTELQ